MHTLFLVGVAVDSRLQTFFVGQLVGCRLRWSLGVTSRLFAASLGCPRRPKWGVFTIWGCGTRRWRRGCWVDVRQTLDNEAAARRQY